MGAGCSEARLPHQPPHVSAWRFLPRSVVPPMDRTPCSPTGPAAQVALTAPNTRVCHLLLGVLSWETRPLGSQKLYPGESLGSTAGPSPRSRPTLMGGLPGVGPHGLLLHGPQPSALHQAAASRVASGSPRGQCAHVSSSPRRPQPRAHAGRLGHRQGIPSA